MNYAYTVTMALPHAAAVERTKAVLRDQGFGILSEIDIRATLSAKLGDTAAGVGDYVILGACNPPLAHRALTAEPEIGLLLPCNVVVRRASGQTVTTVQAIDPHTMAQLSSNPEIAAVAEDAGRRLQSAMDALHAGT